MRDLTEKEMNKFLDRVFEDKIFREKMLRDFGYEVKDYSDDDLLHIIYVITELGGIKDQVKSSKALYMIHQIAKFVTMNNSFEAVGNFTVDLLRDEGVIRFDKGDIRDDKKKKKK